MPPVYEQLAFVQSSSIVSVSNIKMPGQSQSDLIDLDGYYVAQYISGNLIHKARELMEQQRVPECLKTLFEATNLLYTENLNLKNDLALEQEKVRKGEIHISQELDKSKYLIDSLKKKLEVEKEKVIKLEKHTNSLNKCIYDSDQKFQNLSDTLKKELALERARLVMSEEYADVLNKTIDEKDLELANLKNCQEEDKTPHPMLTTSWSQYDQPSLVDACAYCEGSGIDQFYDAIDHQVDNITGQSNRVDACSQCDSPIMVNSQSQCDNPVTTEAGSQISSFGLSIPPYDASTFSNKSSQTSPDNKVNRKCKNKSTQSKTAPNYLKKHCSQCDLLNMAGLASQCAHCHWQTLGIQLSHYDLLLIENVTLSRISQTIRRLNENPQYSFEKQTRLPKTGPKCKFYGTRYIQFPRKRTLVNAELIPRLMDIKTRAPPMSFGPLPYYVQSEKSNPGAIGYLSML